MTTRLQLALVWALPFLAVADNRNAAFTPWFALGVAIWVASVAGESLADGPLVMYLFLRYVSGIPHTEAQALHTRGEDYRNYQRTTPMLIPWPRRKAPAARTQP